MKKRNKLWIGSIIAFSVLAIGSSSLLVTEAKATVAPSQKDNGICSILPSVINDQQMDKFSFSNQGLDFIDTDEDGICDHYEEQTNRQAICKNNLMNDTIGTCYPCNQAGAHHCYGRTN